MPSSFVFLVLILVLKAVYEAKSSSVNVSNKPTPLYAKTIDKMMVCNLIQDSQVSEAIKALDIKLEKLIALINKTSPLLPTPPPPSPPQPTKPPGINWDKYRFFFLVDCLGSTL